MKVALWLPKYSVPLDDPCCYPLGFMYISSALKKSHDVAVFNNNIFPHSPAELLGFDAVCFTGFDEFTEENNRVISFCRSNGIHTVIGGACATFSPEAQTADAVVIGEGENAVNEALTSKGVFQSPAKFTGDLYPDYEGFGIDDYHMLHGHRYMGVLGSRGCPHSCTFCAHTCKYSCRPIQSISDEIDFYIQKYSIKMIVFNDNTLNPSIGRFRRICEMMLDKGLIWSAAIRLDNLTEEVVKLAKRSGMVYAVVGVESFQQRKLDAMNKKITVKEIENGLLLLTKNSIKYHGNVIMGFEGETEPEIRAEFEDLKQRPWNVFPVYLQKFKGVVANTMQSKNLQAEFRQYIYERGMYCYNGA